MTVRVLLEEYLSHFLDEVFKGRRGPMGMDINIWNQKQRQWDGEFRKRIEEEGIVSQGKVYKLEDGLDFLKGLKYTFTSAYLRALNIMED